MATEVAVSPLGASMRDSRTNGSGVRRDGFPPSWSLLLCCTDIVGIDGDGEDRCLHEVNEEIGNDGEPLLGALNPVMKLADMYRSCPTAVPLPVIHSVRCILHTHVELPSTCPRHARRALWERQDTKPRGMRLAQWEPLCYFGGCDTTEIPRRKHRAWENYTRCSTT